MEHLSLLHQLRDGLRHRFHRDVGVGPVLVEQVDVVCPQPSQGTLYGLADGGRAAVQPNGLAVLDGKAKFRGNDHLVPDPLQGLSENLFAGIGAVDLGGVEKGGPLVHRLSGKADHVLLVWDGGIGRDHTHAAEAHTAHGQGAGASQ